MVAVPSAAREGPAGILVHYSFDDALVETGPDTFAVIEDARGSVELSSAYRVSGDHAVEIRDVAGDGDFPELQGYFPERRSGRLHLHFALLISEPAESWNVALAGSGGFALAPDGIAFWLRGRDGRLEHVSDSISRKLFALQPLTWYLVDVHYDVRAGRYDLEVTEEGRDDPRVRLRDQPNATRRPGSSVDRFSFIGDNGSDDSNAVYYVDDVVIGADRPIPPRRFAAPGRRKLFSERYLEQRARLDARPRCLPGARLPEFGIAPREARALLRGPLAAALRADLALASPLGSAAAAGAAAALDDATRQRVMALRLWAAGCRALAAGDAAGALTSQESAARLAPEARRPPLAAVMALTALSRFEEADLRFAEIEAAWRGDPLYPVLMARLGLARGDPVEAEGWLRRPAEALAGSLAGASPRERRLVEQHFYALLWSERLQEAERLALVAIAGLEEAGLPATAWVERAGDVALFLGDAARAQQRYEQALEAAEDPTRVLLKLSDVHFLRGDRAGERALREQIYGSLFRTR